jgi:hypothetical protein
MALPHPTLAFARNATGPAYVGLLVMGRGLGLGGALVLTLTWRGRSRNHTRCAQNPAKRKTRKWFAWSQVGGENRLPVGRGLPVCTVSPHGSHFRCGWLVWAGQGCVGLGWAGLGGVAGTDVGGDRPYPWRFWASVCSPFPKRRSPSLPLRSRPRLLRHSRTPNPALCFFARFAPPEACWLCVEPAVGWGVGRAQVAILHPVPYLTSSPRPFPFHLSPPTSLAAVCTWEGSPWTSAPPRSRTSSPSSAPSWALTSRPPRADQVPPPPPSPVDGGRCFFLGFCFSRPVRGSHLGSRAWRKRMGRRRRGPPPPLGASPPLRSKYCPLV